MPTESVRPVSVPDEAVWLEEEGHWQSLAYDAQGRPSGAVTLWRADGSLLMRAHYDAGVLHGPFARYHADGRVAREGRYDAGSVEGDVWVHAGQGPADEPLRSCCVPQGAARMQARYSEGALLGETFYDAEGFALLSNGTRRPARPANVPEKARYDEGSQRWVHGEAPESSGTPRGTWSWWRHDGSLSEEGDYADGRRVATRHFDANENLRETLGLWPHEGFETIPHGHWRRRLEVGERAAWGVPEEGSREGAEESSGREAWVEGHYAQGRSVGAWQAKLAHAVVWQRDLGTAVCEDRPDASPVFTEEEGDFLVRAETLHQAGRMREALVAVARAVGAGAPVERFVRAHAAWALPKPPNAAEAEARRLSEGEKTPGVADLMDALVTGARPADVLRLLAGAVPAWSRAARDLVQACLALDPDSAQSRLTRAFVCLESADDVRAREDISYLSAISHSTGALLQKTFEVLRPRFAFLPATLEVPALSEPVPLEPAQPSEQVQHVARVYATRLLLLRGALARFGAGNAAWAPPDLSAWLASGPVPLAQHEAQIEDQDEDGALEMTTVKIDETLELTQVGVGAIMRRARADWAGLCWLLWATGKDEIAWPDAIVPRNEYAQALSLAIERAWRARDQVVTAGLRAMTQGVADFTWEDMSVADLPSNLLEVCVDEFIEMRAVLLWLSNPGNLSPFQSDLRQV